jgi:hypothetical protein
MKIIIKNLTFISCFVFVFFNFGCDKLKHTTNISKRDSIISEAITGYDSIMKCKDHNYSIAMRSISLENDTNLIIIFIVNSYRLIASYDLKYLYIWHDIPVFSDFPFIKPTCQYLYEKNLKKLYPKEYPYYKSKILLGQVSIDVTSLIIEFNKNDYIKKRLILF